jgi:hypothetical protein
MVTRLFFLLFLIPLFLFSGEFVATVSRNQVNVGESFTLNLTLKDVSANSSPNTDFLKSLFSIHSQQQMQNTQVVNGHVSSSIVWKLTLIPLKEGKVEIPSMIIDTPEGKLSSNAIMINVVKGSSTPGSGSSDVNEMVLTSYVSNPSPYKNEPFIYTVKIVSKRNCANIAMGKLSLDNAIVESNGEPKVYNGVLDGVNVGVMVFEYLITPLKAGELTIPSTVVQGVIPIQREPHVRNEFDLFSMMRGYDQLKPFALSTEATILNVKPPVAGMNPWLPAKSLSIEEVWNGSQIVQAGEPVTRSFNIVAEGIKSSQLPSLNDLQVNGSNFKIYADKPELNDENTSGNIKSSRKEQFTIIPQKAGELILPELSIAWWDVSKNEKIVTKIPARTLQVLPAAQNSRQNNEVAALDTPISSSVSHEMMVQKDPILYVIIVVLAILLLAAILWAIILQRKIYRLKTVKIVKKAPINYEKYAPKKLPAKEKQEKLPDLNPT